MTSPSLIELSQGLSAVVKEATAAVVGVVVTAHHGVEWEDGIEIGLPSGRSVPAEVAGRDPSTDLAVLLVAESGLTPPRWSEAPLELGALLLVATRPGRLPRVSMGVLSRLGDAWRTPMGGKVDQYLELDVGLQPGFSGGLVVDAAGDAIGMATAGLARGTGLALPLSTLRRVVEVLVAHGAMRRGYLGVATLPVRVPAGLAQQVQQAAALLVTAVEEESPASRAGIMLGDLLLRIDETPLAQLRDLLPLLDEERIGTTARARVARGGAVQELQVSVGARGGRDGGSRP
jgi:S1-C subfamily serine protease